MHFSVRRFEDNLNSRMNIWPERYGPLWVRGVNPANRKMRGSFGTNAKFKIILERKCLKGRKAKMNNPRMGVPEIKKISIYE